MTKQPDARPLMLYLLIACLAFLSVSGFAGGIGLLTDVSGGNLQYPLQWLDGSPFSNYLIPGLFLFVVFGVGSAVLLFALWKRPHAALLDKTANLTHEHWSWVAALAMGVILVLWIVIELLIINEFSWFHIVYALLGIVIATLDWRPSVRQFYAQS
jgi:hypothetical protein